MANNMTLEEKIAIVEMIANLDDENSVSFCRHFLAEAWEIEKAKGDQSLADFYRKMATFSMMPKSEQQRLIGRVEGMKDKLEEMFAELKKRTSC